MQCCWQALGEAEDESDIQAANVARAEKKEELAEFDESIPWDEREVNAKREREEQSKVEMELALLDKEVSSRPMFSCYLLLFVLFSVAKLLLQAVQNASVCLSVGGYRKL